MLVSTGVHGQRSSDQDSRAVLTQRGRFRLYSARDTAEALMTDGEYLRYLLASWSVNSHKYYKANKSSARLHAN